MSDSGLWSKEMVDLLLEIKRRARGRHGVAFSLAEEGLLARLAALMALEDPHLCALIESFAARVGEDWYREVRRAGRTAAPRRATVRIYRGRPVLS